MEYAFDFNRIIDRRNTGSLKWEKYGKNVLPLWVADMDFPAPEPIITELGKYVTHGIFGYPHKPDELKETISERLFRLYSWAVSPDEIVILPGVVTGFNLAVQALAEPGTGYIIQPPVYPPFYKVEELSKIPVCEAPLVFDKEKGYKIDFEAFKKKLSPEIGVFLLCNPHNPVGRVFSRDELEKLASLCIEKGVYICSDEIHSDLVYNGFRHYPIASLGKEISGKTITLMAPSKTFNIAGLGCSFAVIQNKDLLDRFLRARRGLVSDVNILGLVAAKAAYKMCEPWLNSLLSYLKDNRDYITEYIAKHCPGLKYKAPEGTYLAWLDFTELSLPKEPGEYLLERAGVALNEGSHFGLCGKGFARLNFACPRKTLEKALENISRALYK